MLVEPGFFRPELPTPESTTYAVASIGDHAGQTAQSVAAWKGMKGLQGGDPAKAGRRAGPAGSPGRAAAAGTDAVATIEEEAAGLLVQAYAHRELSSSLALEDV